MVGKLVMKGEKSLEGVELYVDTLQNAAVHCLDDSRDRREGDSAQGDEALEGAEGNGDEFCCTAHEDGANLRLGIACRYFQEVLVVVDLPQDERQNKQSQRRDCLVMALNSISVERKKNICIFSRN
jgi:hypothetical protein